MAKLCFSGGVLFCCFFCSSLLRASRSGKIKVVARTDVFSAGGGVNAWEVFGVESSLLQIRVSYSFFVV